jgi:hypothetical protein
MERDGHIDLEILSDDPVPAPLETALRGFLCRFPGHWRVRVNQRLTGGWTAITLDTEGFHRVFFAAPAAPTVDTVLRQIREALTPGPMPPEPWDGSERRARRRG